jgi:CHAT domain-containing protein
VFGLGHTFEETDPDSAAFYYERGLDLLDETRSGIGGAEVKTGYLGGVRRHYYEEVAGYYARLARKGMGEEWEARAFATIERAKARGLLSLIETTVLAEASAEEEAVLDSLYRLDEKAPGYAERKYALENRYTRLRSERVDAAMGSAVPKTAAPDPADLQKRLPKKTAMLAYALGDSVSFVWAIDRKGTKLFRLPGRGTLRPEVEQLRDAVARPGPGDEALRSSARRLYEKLVAPCEKRIAGAESLVIVPDGFLFEVPFEILLREPAGEGKAWGGLAYLAKSFSTLYAPSASIYAALSKAKKPRRDTDLFALGDPDYSLLVSSGSSRGFEPLPHARAEVTAIASNVDDRHRRVWLGGEADEARYKEFMRGSSARVVHLATHGVSDPAEPAASAVILCPDAARNEDGYLHTLEIISTPIDAGLVVVSACESAGGRIGRGEGVVGLSRAFLAAGAGGVVASLWAVSDESTAALMKEFYRRMFADKQPAARALAGARLALLADPDRAHPFYWSPFVVIGSHTSPW